MPDFFFFLASLRKRQTRSVSSSLTLLKKWWHVIFTGGTMMKMTGSELRMPPWCAARNDRRSPFIYFMFLHSSYCKAFIMDINYQPGSSALETIIISETDAERIFHQRPHTKQWEVNYSATQYINQVNKWCILPKMFFFFFKYNPIALLLLFKYVQIPAHLWPCLCLLYEFLR